MLIASLAWSNGAWGEQYYVLTNQNTSDVEIMNGGSIPSDKYYSWDGPGATLRFQYRFGSAAYGEIEVYAYTDKNHTQGETKLETIGKKKSDTWKDINLDAKYRSVRFHATPTARKWIKNVSVTRATTLSASNVSFGEVKLNKTQSETIEVTYSNGFNPQTFSATTTSPGFTVTNISDQEITAETGKVTVTFSFTPTEAKNYSGTATLELGSTTTTISLSGTGTITKANPTFTWNMPSTAYTKRTYRNFFETTNDEAGITVTSNNQAIAQYIGGNLYFPGATGNVSITISQPETTNYYAKSQTYDITVEEAINRVPFTINNATNYGIYVTEISNRSAYTNDGIRLGGNSNVIDDLISGKEAIIEFSGIPDKLSFTTSVGGLAPTGIGFYVQEMDENGTWSDNIWTSSDRDNTVNDLQLKPTTRGVRVHYNGNYWAFIKNLTVTELRYLRADKEFLDFGTNTKGNSVSTQTFTISHCNAGNNVSITCSDPNFSITPTSLTTTGGDLMGTQVITVHYLNNTTGVHNGTITISDPNGTNSPISLNVSGTTQTTYYTRAEAEAGEGGSAYVSYISSEDAAARHQTSTLLKSSNLTSEANAKNNAYWIAVPEQGYSFVEWQWPDGTQASTNASDKWEGYEYSSEDQNNPTVVKFKAIFAPKILTLQPTSSAYTVDYYKTVCLGWALKSGYSTIALPFNTTVETLTGREANDDDWVAQLSVVTYNGKDGYSLYFSKSNTIEANQPYILHLGTAVESPVFTNVNVVAAEEATKNATNGVHLTDWTMHSNYDPAFDMNGYYGVVNGEDVLKKGSTGSTLKAFHAYITGPAAAGVKAAYLDEDEADAILELLKGEATEPENIYDLQGRQLPRAGKGINIIRNADGTVRKVMMRN